MKIHTKLMLAAYGACATLLGVAQAPLCVDTSFRPAFLGDEMSGLDFMSNGQILVGGILRHTEWINWKCRSRLNADGSLDATFDQVVGASAGEVQIWGDDYFFQGTGSGVIRCFLSTGTADVTYRTPLPEFSGGGGGFHIFPDGKMWRTGWHIKQFFDEDGNWSHNEPGYGLIQVRPDGRTDTTFDHKYTAPGSLTSIFETPDGRFLFGATTGTHYEGRPVGGLIRTWPDARLDTTFNTTFLSWGQVGGYYMYPDGRMLVFGDFIAPEYPGDTVNVLRLHPDGSTDASWPNIDLRYEEGYYSGFGTVMDHLEVEPGKLILVGEFDHVNGAPVGCLAVIDTAGQVLLDYFPYGGAGGLQTSQSTSPHRYIARIKEGPDGFIYLRGKYRGFEDACGNHPDHVLLTRLYPLDVGVRDIAPELTLGVMPNPSNGRFNLNYPAQPEAGLLEVLDATGGVVYRSRLAAGSQVHNVPLEGAAAGLYLCRVRWGAQTVSTRIILTAP